MLRGMWLDNDMNTNDNHSNCKGDRHDRQVKVPTTDDGWVWVCEDCWAVVNEDNEVVC